MNIKKIIREEVNDFEWADNINPTPYDGIKFHFSMGSNTIYTLEDNGSNDIIAHSPIEHESSYSFTRDYVERQFNLGQWVMVNNINESEFDWTNDINPTPLNDVMFKIINTDDTIYTLEDNGSDNIIIHHPPDDYNAPVELNRFYVNDSFERGSWIKINNINESGFDWADDISAYDKPYVGLRFIHKNDISDRNPNGFTYTVIGVNEESYTVEWYEGGEDNTYDDTVTTYQNWIMNDKLIFVDDVINH